MRAAGLAGPAGSGAIADVPLANGEDKKEKVRAPRPKPCWARCYPSRFPVISSKQAGVQWGHPEPVRRWHGRGVDRWVSGVVHGLNLAEGGGHQDMVM